MPVWTSTFPPFMRIIYVQSPSLRSEYRDMCTASKVFAQLEVFYLFAVTALLAA